MPALLHDIGQFAPGEDLKLLLALGLSKKVARLVESHVAAKRYLCAVDEAYWGTLSDASKKRLEYQGA